MISAWTSKDRILASYRVNGELDIRDLGAAAYTAYVRSGTMIDREDYVSRKPDFPGWDCLVFASYDARKLAHEKYGDLLFEADVSPVRRFLSDNNCRVDAPRRVFLDIETDSRVPPRDQVPREGYTPPTARIVSWALVDGAGYEHVDVLEDDSDDAEFDLLCRLWAAMSPYDQVAAWNGDGFDFPVIEHRSQAVGRTRRNFDVYWNNRRRLLFVDHLACFKRHHMAPESGDDKTSLKLGDVCQSIIGEGKHDFDARNTWEAWAKGGVARQEMADYNLQDTRLLAKLEVATGYLELQQTLAEVTLTFANSHGLKPMPQVDGYMLRMANRRKTHLPSKKKPTGHEAQYEGAYVMPPKSIGVHRMVHVCDFKSLYPTVIRTWNMSPETKGSDGCTAFGTGAKFSTESEGMLAAACREGMELRETFKQKAKADPNDKDAERKNKAYKIFCNSIYGVMGSPWSRYYDVQLAESITLGAKTLILKVIEEAAKRGWECIYSDTDSSFVKGCTVEEFKEFVDYCNTVIFPAMLDAQGCGRQFQCICLDYEKCFDRLVFPLGEKGVPSAKRYFGSYHHYAFKPKTKPEIRGLEYMRGDGVRIARHLQKDAIDKILAGSEDVQLEEWVQAMRHKIMTAPLEVEEIMLSKGLGQDLVLFKGNPAHVRVARELEARGEDIGQGSRIAYVITNGQSSPTEVISATDFDGAFDRHHAWNQLIYPSVLRVLAGAFPTRNWKRWLAKRPKPVLKGQLGLGLT